MLSSWLELPRVRWVAIAWTLSIFILSAIPGKDLPHVDFFQSDKLIHAIIYGCMTFLWAKGFKSMQTGLLWAILFSTFFGMSMEWMQENFFVDRYFDWMDVLANEIGVILIPLFFRKRI